MGLTKAIRRLGERYSVAEGKRFRLDDFDPADTRPLRSKEAAQGALAADIERLTRLQEKLYAQDRWALLLVFQAMDAAGKDSTIKHVMSGVNPQGCAVHAFKSPSAEELGHDFLWRTTVRLPARGQIGIFNRSYYEEVLVVRVHPDFLERQKMPPSLVTRRVWDERFESINAFERHLARNGTVIRKFFLHVSKEEQRRRFLERLEEPAKNWKFSLADVEERRHFKAYMRAYEEMIARTSTRDAPWYVVPADHKWFTRLVVASVIVETLEGLGLEFPQVDAAKRKELKAARRALRLEKD